MVVCFVVDPECVLPCRSHEGPGYTDDRGGDYDGGQSRDRDRSDRDYEGPPGMAPEGLIEVSVPTLSS